MTIKSLPHHVAIIMDGNGRWAKAHHLTRSQGHLEGVKRVEEIVSEACRCGIKGRIFGIERDQREGKNGACAHKKHTRRVGQAPGDKPFHMCGKKRCLGRFLELELTR